MDTWECPCEWTLHRKWRQNIQKRIIFCLISFTFLPIPTLPKYFSPSYPIKIVTSLCLKATAVQSYVFYKIFNTSFQVEKLPDGKAYWLSVVLCFILFPFAWTGGCLVMTQLSNKFVPFEKLLTKNALYQSSVGFFVVRQLHHALAYPPAHCFAVFAVFHYFYST